MDKQAILKRIITLIKERGMTPTPFGVSLGLSNSAFTDWKKGKGFPSTETIVKFAEYFCVSIDYLIYGTKKSISSSPQERSLLQKFKNLPPELQTKALTYIDGMLAASEVTIKNSENSKNRRIS